MQEILRNYARQYYAWYFMFQADNNYMLKRFLFDKKTAFCSVWQNQKPVHVQNFKFNQIKGTQDGKFS
jgi:hypothetical protein